MQAVTTGYALSCPLEKPNLLTIFQVSGQGSGPRLGKKEGEEEDTFDAMGNKVERVEKKAKLTSAELRKKKKDRMARRKRGEEVFSDEE